MIKATELLVEVIRRAKEKPAQKAKCVYFNTDATPCCIVGQGLADLGVDPYPFIIDNELNAWTSVISLGGEWIDKDDSRAVRTLSLIQRWQDKGYTWGEALAYAEEAIADETDQG